MIPNQSKTRVVEKHRAKIKALETQKKKLETKLENLQFEIEVWKGALENG